MYAPPSEFPVMWEIVEADMRLVTALLSKGRGQISNLEHDAHLNYPVLLPSLKKQH
jgi:hypothetical protein